VTGSITVTLDYNSSNIELLNDVCFTNLYEESLTAVWFSDWFLISRILNFDSNSSSVILSVVPGILCLATCYLVATRSLLSVVICISVATGMRVYQTVVQQRPIPRCHGNVLSEALPTRWSYSGFQASCHIILTSLSKIYALDFP
jgi:hypothetical protein